ncbi:hypothetical protein [Roseobacter sp. HKCCD7870]|uniref:hypothetical protein n=1 Tax=Roseobacter sp. HKCCD7870 TaxID=3120343 RepID=UPI0030ECA4CA
MKHILTAALIATALASPVRGETITLICTDGRTYWDDVRREAILVQSEFVLDKDLMTVSVSRFLNPGPIPLAFWSDEAIGWMYQSLPLPNDLHGALHSAVLDIKTMRLSSAVVSNEGITQRQENCTRPL